MPVFSLIDRISELKPNESIVAEKTLHGTEEYLSDHFPNFPCMPGVLMLEAMYQAGCWLLRQSDGFKRPIVMLKEARNVKYGSFVGPGQTLVVTVNLTKQIDDSTYKLKGQGMVEGRPAVSGIMVLDQFRSDERFDLPLMSHGVGRREYVENFHKLYESATVETA